MSRNRACASWGLSVLLLLATVGCSDAEGDAAGPPIVVTTTPILGDVVESMLGDAVEVQVVMPRGADPHDFQASARQIAELRDATLIVANGLGLESGLEQAIEGAADDGVPVFEVAPELDPIPFAATEHDQGALDPHVWQDPSRMAAAVPLILDALIDADPTLDTEAVRSSAAAYEAELRALDAEVEDTLSVVPPERRLLVTNHDTFGYLADRYGFEVVGVVVPGGDTLAEPSAAGLSVLAEELETRGIPAVFADNTTSTGLAEALADEVGSDVAVVELYTDSLGPEGDDAGTYVGMIRANASSIASALG